MTDQKTYLGNFLINQKAGDSSVLLTQKYDLVLTFVSWEERCLSVIDTNASASVAVVCRFQTETTSVEREKNYRKLSTWADDTAKFSEFSALELSFSTNSQANFSLIMSMMLGLQKKFGRQLKVLVDASSCPKSISAFLVGFGFGRGILKQLDLFYAHSDYDNKSEKDDKGNGSEKSLEFYRFTDGKWSSILIPYLEGTLRATAPRSLIVAVGAETYATEAFLKRYQPEKLQFLLPSPSVTDVMEKSLALEIDRLVERMELKTDDISRVPPYDMIAAAKKMNSMLEEADEKYDLMVACVGTKPHAIGAAIAAFLNPNAALVCRVPNKYLEIPGKGNGKASLFSIEDLSAF
jgi:SAM-dependent methyltransferase